MKKQIHLTSLGFSEFSFLGELFLECSVYHVPPFTRSELILLKQHILKIQRSAATECDPILSICIHYILIEATEHNLTMLCYFSLWFSKILKALRQLYHGMNLTPCRELLTIVEALGFYLPPIQ